MQPPSDPSEAASPFALTGPQLIARGYSAIPIKPGEKVPGLMAGSDWLFHKGWNRFCSQLPGSFQVGLWSRWPKAGVGVALGRGLLAVDIDRDQLVAPVKAVLPTTPVAKRGRKGETLFFRGDTDRLRSRGFKIDGFGVLDFLSFGKQTVLPPTLHPATGLPYEWTTERTLLDTKLDELPEFTEAHFEAMVDVLKAHGWKAEASFDWSGEIVESDSQASDFFRRLNEDALANLDAWVPQVGLHRKVRQADGGYRAVAHWRPSSSGKPLGRRGLNLSFDRTGIVDFGDAEKTYTPLNVVMKCHDLADFQIDQAARWLGEALGYDFRPQFVLTSKAKPAERPPGGGPAPLATEAAGHSDLMISPEAIDSTLETISPEEAERVAAVEPYRAPKVDPKAERMEALTRLAGGIPGLVGDLVSWIDGSAPSPSKILALGAALTLVGTLAGRQYKGPTGLLTNLYALGLADSGFGKDHARDCIKNLCAAAGLMRFLGGSKIMSGSAIRKKLEAQPTALWLLDEFGGFVGEIANPRSGPHVQQIRYFILELYSAAKTSFLGADYAGEQGTPIHNPNACIYGTSTPADFWGAMSSRAVADGFLPRFLILPVTGPRPAKVKPIFAADVVPQNVLDPCRALIVPRGGNLAGRTTDGTTAIDPIRMPWGKDGEAAFEALQAKCEREHDKARPEAKAIWTRVAENALKIAMIVAIGVDPEAPEVHGQWVDWAGELAILCAQGTIEEIAGRLADNDRQREHLDVRRWIEEAGPKGLTRTQLSRRVNGRFNAKRLGEICHSLDEDEKAIVVQMGETTPNGGRKAARFVARCFLGQVESAEE